MDPHGGEPVVEDGLPLGQAPAVVIMVHGRNAGPANILDLVPRLDRPGLTYLAPAASGRTWYPLSFMAEIARNEPGVTSGLTMLESLVTRVERAGIPRSRIVMLGFSQGACLTSEFAARHASRFGGFVLFTGGLLGPPGTPWNYAGNFSGTPIFLGSGDPDSHVPVSRVLETADVFRRLGAAVTTRIYPGRGHFVSDDEIALARTLIDGVAGPRVVFDAGAVRRLAGEIDAMGCRRVLVVTTPGRAEALRALPLQIGHRLAGIADLAAAHVPIERVRDAVREVDRVQADALLAIGGGSAVGLAKAVALERPIPIAAVPTTYSGSEMTNVWGITEGRTKRTGRDPRVAPRVVIYDPELTVSLPPELSAASGMNAMAHAVEAVYAADADDAAIASAEEAIRLLARALPQVVARPDGLEARSEALRGAHYSGLALQRASMGLHHKICHVLGGSFGLPHALTHAVVLPRVVAFIAPAAPEAMRRISAALGATDAAAGLRALNEQLGLTRSLRELGLPAEDAARAAELVAASPYPSPRPASAADVRELLTP